jgi:hypothetical protein
MSIMNVSILSDKMLQKKKIKEYANDPRTYVQKGVKEHS